MATYLAIDIGASSGRHILGRIRDGKIEEQEIYRFTNGAHEQDGHLVWDVEHLFDEIVAGLKSLRNAVAQKMNDLSLQFHNFLRSAVQA